MTFLSVVERELRVAARRNWTYWGRVSCAAAFIILAIGFLISESQVPVGRVSRDMFVMLSVIGWFGALLVGSIATADCISVEKRDGTLGLLFLTDLRGYDIVFGKLLGNGVNAILGFLGAMPVLAMPLLMGGVSAWQFFQVELFILVGLIYAMSAGIMVSTLVRSGRKAYVMTLCLVLIMTLGILAAEGAWTVYRTGNYPYPQFARISPFVGFLASMEPMTMRGKNDIFWHSLAATVFQIVFFWVVASVRLPWVWQERAPSVRQVQWRERFTRWSLGRAGERKEYRKAMLDRNPICWLDDRYRLLKTILWAVLLGGTVFWMWLLSINANDMLEPAALIITGLVANNILVLWVALETTQRFAEDRRTGAFELLLGTTISVREIISGRLLALRRQFGWPILAALGAEVVLLLAVLSLLEHRFWWEWHETLLLTGIAVGGIVIFLCEVVAVVVTGLWAGLTSANAMMATVKTTLRVVVLHWLLFVTVLIGYDFVCRYTRFRLFTGRSDEIAALVAWVFIGLLVCVSAVVINWLRLTRRLRQVVSEPRRQAWWLRWIPGLRQ